VEGFSDVGRGEKFGFKRDSKFPSQEGMPWKEMELRTRKANEGKT
jgi:hypothetical protein